MAYTVTQPKRLSQRVRKQKKELKNRRDRLGKGLLGRIRAAIAGASEHTDTGEYGRRKGMSGEEAVAERLGRLPDGWFIVNDVRVAGNQIDHIAFGPKGVFCIETKHSGTVRIDGDGNFYRLEQRMWVPAKSPAVQNMRHVQGLREFLRGRFDPHPPVRSVIVYVGRGRFELETLTVPPGHTRITFFNNLIEHLLAQPDIPFDTTQLRAMAFAVAGR